MITKIQNSLFAKPVAVLLTFSFLFMSFTMKGDGSVVLNSGKIVTLETTSIIQSDRISVGQIIDFRVVHDIKVDNKTVIAAGSIAKGQVMRARKAKGIGKEGFLEIQIKTATAVDGQTVHLTDGNLYQEGDEKETLSVVLAIFVCILFLTLKGKNAEVPSGYQVSSTVASTLTISV